MERQEGYYWVQITGDVWDVCYYSKIDCKWYETGDDISCGDDNDLKAINETRIPAPDEVKPTMDYLPYVIGGDIKLVLPDKILTTTDIREFHKMD